ncbi:MAG: hypothetical protein A3F40_00160 [Chlamydiae bacterium RIFCSPHIGHO2_12_FULL_27_8]|nr:MAG: hypothetical protein A3F40_00160 [Chlamydiae bacterium RIFCSPHIGHO2_12_FULL_27_8]
MNILGFIFTILMIFSIITNNLYLKAKNETIFSSSLNGFMKASRNLNNNFEKEIFKNLKTNNEKKEKILSKTRNINILNAKMNLYPLLDKKKSENAEYYNLAAKLIKELYKESDFYQEGFEFFLLDRIILNDKNTPSLDRIDLNNSKFQKIYYKMLKGSKTYNIPSFLDYFTIKEKDFKIPIKDASFELLKCAFSTDLAYKIKNEQLVNPVNFENISTFISNEKYSTLFDYSKRAQKIDSFLVGIDKETNIQILKR